MLKSEIREILRNSKKVRTSDYDKDTNYAIFEAAHSDDKELRQEANLFVHDALVKYETSILSKYGILRNSSNYEDYRQEMYIAIHQHLRNWNPEKGQLVTYFAPIFDKVCMKERNKTSPFESRYYEEMANRVKKAKEIMLSYGVKHPTAEQIREVVNATFDSNVGIKTIKKTLEMDVEFAPMDSCAEFSGEDFVDRLINGDSCFSERVEGTIEQMTGENAAIMRILCEFYKDDIGEKQLTTRALADKLATYTGIGTYSSADVRNARRCAEREFRSLYKRC